MTAPDVDALEAARAAATPGPWHVVQDEDVTEVWSPTAEIAAYSNPADAALIVAAVNNLDDLIAAVRERDALRAAVERSLTMPRSAFRALLADVDGGGQR